MIGVSRRQFLKGSAIFIASIPFINPVRLLQKGDGTPLNLVREPTGNPIVDLFYSEVDLLPVGSVAHSIVGVEYLPYFVSFDEDMLLRGLSLGQNNSGKYWAFAACREPFVSDLRYRRGVVDDVMAQLRIGWRKSRVRWIKAPSGFDTIKTKTWG